MKKPFRVVLIVLIIIFTSGVSSSQDKEFFEKLNQAKLYSGFQKFYWNEKEGKIWFEISGFNTEFLYVNSLPYGIGSNDIGLDRGQLGSERIVKFEKHGGKILLVQPNYTYRADSGDVSERTAVEQSFAQSVLWGFKIEAERDGAYFVDATDFLLSDGKNIPRTLNSRGQGKYTLDKNRSAFDLKYTKNFPYNSEFQVILTFKGEPKGREIYTVSPDPRFVTIRERRSFVKLPDDGFESREFDPRAGYFPLTYYDYSAPIDQLTERKLIFRHRLKKKFPDREMSEPVEPIVYYIDNSAPEPIRSALLEGASWWNQAFEAAGFINAFQIKILPQDADPMDVRYNVVQWVHRSTRGWSYGGSVSDPRTGEIIKGHISLGSLRIRQDYLIAQSLSGIFSDSSNNIDELKAFALARIRQLSAHEVGHSLGLTHNFAASISDRASVMDYPHPLIKIGDDGAIDLSGAYATGIGEWDKFTIRYGYSEFSENVKENLTEIIEEYLAKGLKFISDSDARAPGGAHPFAHLWDNGEDAADELNRVLKIREIGLANFSEKRIPPNSPYAKLEDLLVPLYYFHRYQTEAAVKLIGGLEYSYALSGDGQTVTELLNWKTQEKALRVVLKTLSPAILTLPERIVKLLPPRAIGYGKTRESFKGNTGITFDPVAAAESAADFTLSLLLNPQRAARLVEYNARNKDLPGLDYVLEELLRSTIKMKANEGLEKCVKLAIDEVVLDRILSLALNESCSALVHEAVHKKLFEMKDWIDGQLKLMPVYEQSAHLMLLKSKLKTYIERPDKVKIRKVPAIPPGSPI